MRLPAFSAGVLFLAPLGFILAERWYGKQTAIFAGILIAMTPELIPAILIMHAVILSNGNVHNFIIYSCSLC